MANKNAAGAAASSEKQGKENTKPAPVSKMAKLKRILKFSVIAILLLALIAGGFFLGIYLRIFDVNTINEKMELYKYPVIGEYFVKPVKDDRTDASLTDAKLVDQTAPAKTSKPEDAKIDPAKLSEPSKPVLLTKEQMEKQMKQKQAEEQKRISKLARLYGQMKPQEAVAILDSLDDDMTIAILQKMDEGQTAKILATFDPEKSSRLTKIMYSGKPPAITQVP